jgi:hypothetical protein
MISNQYSANISDVRLYLTCIARDVMCYVTLAISRDNTTRCVPVTLLALILTDLCKLQMCSKCGPCRKTVLCVTCTPHSALLPIRTADPNSGVQHFSKLDRPISLPSVTEHSDTDTQSVLIPVTSTNSATVPERTVPMSDCTQDTAGLKFEIRGWDSNWQRFEPALCHNAHLFLRHVSDVTMYDVTGGCEQQNKPPCATTLIYVGIRNRYRTADRQTQTDRQLQHVTSGDRL